ncbi:AI-2E family transporter [Latilactobacillus fuchuensis]|uniref:AI-2E family transporter n=1 Tax=Latilactobacillus fuchuensis TaxID=164393 RepID=UPI0020C819D4|nr:AI-2E family transporter [Latilactobacillus fuchuensis]MCP8857116.1 AI-2E family transporter [Latilactobacillus fuchuensis]
MAQRELNETKQSWFFKWFLNKKLPVVLLNVLLTLLIILLMTKLAWLLQPIQSLLTIIGLPVIIAAVLYYLTNPLIDWLENKWHLNRVLAITILFIAIIGLIAWGIATLIPVIQSQTTSLIKYWPDYWQNIQKQTMQWFNDPSFKSIQKQLNDINTDVLGSLSDKLNKMVSSTVSHIGTAVGVVTNIVIAIVTMPFILFFMLKDGHRLKAYLTHFFPNRVRATTGQVLHEINGQVSQYIRGQLTVAFWVAIMFTAGYWIVGMKYALTLGILAGILNLIPYLGSFLAMVPSVIIALFISPLMLVKVLIVFAIEQTLEGRLVSPLVLGSKMAMYPVTTIIVLLASGKLFGLAGVILGIPVYAIIKILVSHLFDWFRTVSGLYND